MLFFNIFLFVIVFINLYYESVSLTHAGLQTTGLYVFNWKSQAIFCL